MPRLIAVLTMIILLSIGVALAKDNARSNNGPPNNSPPQKAQGGPSKDSKDPAPERGHKAGQDNIQKTLDLIPRTDPKL